MKVPELSKTRRLPNSGHGSGVCRGQPSSEPQVKLEKLYSRCRRNRKGAAAVEFAVIAPVFFLLIFGMIEFGRAIMVQQIITNASREGARIAVLDGTTGSEVRSAVESYLQRANLNGAQLTLDPTEPSTAGYGEPVTVTVQIPYSQVSWLPPMLIGGSTQLTATTVMRRETVQ